jgi:hypothetical protein
MKSWEEIGFRIEITGDGSPSLRLLQSSTERFTEGEAMHHSGGAATETDLIYGECARRSFAKNPRPHFLVVGLGLGYIEMTIAKEGLRRGLQAQSILSFESVPELKEYFIRWIHDQDLKSEVKETYDQAALGVLKNTSLSLSELKEHLKLFFKSPTDIQGALNEDAVFSVRYEGILYDAFSSKTSPLLWEEAFLKNFLQKTAAPIADFATYACKGSLKRALQAQGFQVEMLEGFQGKRNRISASRSPVVLK